MEATDAVPSPVAPDPATNAVPFPAAPDPATDAEATNRAVQLLVRKEREQDEEQVSVDESDLLLNLRKLLDPMTFVTDTREQQKDKAAEHVLVTAGCVLWDVSCSAPNARFLFESGVLMIIDKLLGEESHSTRLREVLCGILANMGSVSPALCHAIAKQDQGGLAVRIVSLLWSSSDVSTLREVFRLLYAALGLSSGAWVPLLLETDVYLTQTCVLFGSSLDNDLQERAVHVLLAAVCYHRALAVPLLLQQSISVTMLATIVVQGAQGSDVGERTPRDEDNQREDTCSPSSSEVVAMCVRVLYLLAREPHHPVPRPQFQLRPGLAQSLVRSVCTLIVDAEWEWNAGIHCNACILLACLIRQKDQVVRAEEQQEGDDAKPDADSVLAIPLHCAHAICKRALDLRKTYQFPTAVGLPPWSVSSSSLSSSALLPSPRLPPPSPVAQLSSSSVAPAAASSSSAPEPAPEASAPSSSSATLPSMPPSEEAEGCGGLDGLTLKHLLVASLESVVASHHRSKQTDPKKHKKHMDQDAARVLRLLMARSDEVRRALTALDRDAGTPAIEGKTETAAAADVVRDWDETLRHLARRLRTLPSPKSLALSALLESVVC